MGEKYKSFSASIVDAHQLDMGISRLPLVHSFLFELSRLVMTVKQLTYGDRGQGY
jgi:hypothetical protein